MSVDDKRVAGCQGKARFTTFTRAQKIAHRQAQRRKGKFSAYACELCGGFHVGTSLGTAGGGGGKHVDGRQRFMVYACDTSGKESLVGWSNASDGGGVTKLIANEPGWRITRVVQRRKKAA